MIAKKYRLKEREVKKVLHKGKPFFSYTIVFNVFPNKLEYSRFAIVIGRKSAVNNVVRNNYRRVFYDICAKYKDIPNKDIVCVVKSKKKLQKEPDAVKAIASEINYLFEKRL